MLILHLLGTATTIHTSGDFVLARDDRWSHETRLRNTAGVEVALAGFDESSAGGIGCWSGQSRGWWLEPRGPHVLCLRRRALHIVVGKFFLGAVDQESVLGENNGGRGADNPGQRHRLGAG